MYLPLFLHDSQMHDRVADEMFKHLNMKYYQNILTCLNFLVQVSSEACNILFQYICTQQMFVCTDFTSCLNS
jgi:hypothetical protein